MARRELLALLEACKREPQDDAARLVLADWLEEHGDEEDRRRADFVRLEATSGEKKGRPDFRSLRRRHWERALGRWAPFHTSTQRCENAGGLVDASVSLGALRRDSPLTQWAGREEWAWVDRLRISPEAGQRMDVLRSPLLATIGTLVFQQMDLSGVAAEALGSSADLATLRGIWLAHCPAVDLMPLLRSPYLSGLRALCVWGDELPEEAFAALSRPDVLPALEHLDLPPTVGRAKYAAALTPRGRRLRSLCLRHEMRVADLRALGQSDACSGLRQLDVTLSRNRFPLEALAGARFWPTLESLDVMNVAMTDEAATALARVKVSGLRSLSIRGPRASPAALASLAGSPLLASLNSLNLGSQPIGPALVPALMTMSAAPLTLTLSSCGIADEGLIALAGWPGMSRCQMLHVANNQLTAAAVRELADSPHLGGLVGLNVVFNPIGDAGIEVLMRAPWLGGLEYLAVSDCEGGAGGAAALTTAARRMPRLKQLGVGKEMKTPALLEAFAHVPYVE